MTAATMAVNRPGAKSATAGIRYTNAGRVWAASRNGRMAVRKRSLRADRIPRRMPSRSVAAVATRTLARVSMPCSHSPNPMASNRHAAAVMAGRRPEMYHAPQNTTPTTSHQGELVRTVWIGLRMLNATKSLIAVVATMNVDLIHATISLTGSRRSIVVPPGNAVGSARVWAKTTPATTTPSATR